MPAPTRPRLRRIFAAVSSVLLVLSVAVLANGPGQAGQRAPIISTTSSFVASDGQTYTVTNHLTSEASRGWHHPREWLLIWAGAVPPDEPAATAVGTHRHQNGAGQPGTAPPGPQPDFIAVIDATRHSPSYGKVVNTATVDPQRQNEPHHMQYIWHRGDPLYAGGIISDTTYVFDISRLPELRLTGVNTPADTPCGSVPDAYSVLRDGTAYASYMGGPDVTGACEYTNGEVRVGNGFAGSPGEIVRIGPDGSTLAEAPAMAATGEAHARCTNRPLLEIATCANPHGIAVREDLDRLVSSDFAEIRHYLDQPAGEFDPFLIRDTVRIFDISDRNDPRLVSVSHLPTGPREEELPVFEEEKLVMEVTVPHRRHHRGAFASTMWGGAVYYTPDITDPTPEWREVFDDETAYRTFQPDGLLRGAGDGGSWLQVSPDDRFLFHTVMGVHLGGDPDLTSGMVYVLDIRKMLASGNRPACSIDTMIEVSQGGMERDCPQLVSVLPIRDITSGGPHWAAMDNFTRGRGGKYRETSQIDRLAVANYFLARLGGDGDHRVCLVKVSRTGRLSLDTSFRDEVTGETCISFDRTNWPHGPAGDARPHGVLFAVADKDIRPGHPRRG